MASTPEMDYVRALYVHSMPDKINKNSIEPPEVFYYGNEKVWLADSIPSKYITEI